MKEGKKQKKYYSSSSEESLKDELEEYENYINDLLDDDNSSAKDIMKAMKVAQKFNDRDTNKRLRKRLNKALDHPTSFTLIDSTEYYMENRYLNLF